MKILHLFANWKWTGPADPALTTAAIQSRSHDVLFVSGQSPQGKPSAIQPHVEARGVETVTGFHLGKHARFRPNREDVRKLIVVLRERRPDVVHCHLDNDHRIASLAVQEAPVGAVVRTSYDTTGLSGGFRTRRVARRAMDGLIVTTQAGWDATLEAYGGSARSVSLRGRPVPLVRIEPGIDLERYRPGHYDRAAARARLGLAPDDVALGVVARVQTHRRYELIIEAVRDLAPRLPRLKVVVLGRGTNIEQVLHEPVRRFGLGDVILSPGYVAGDEYPALLAGLDGSLFLVPGSDGTCRALREQMAMGLPPIVGTRPPLPEIVEENTSGLVVEESVDGLRRGIERLVTEAEYRERLGRGAAAVAARRFDVQTQVRLVTEFYERVLSEKAPA